MVEPQPPPVAATVPVRGLKCRGGDAAAEPAMAGTPNRGQERGGEEGEEEEKAVLRRGLAAARARRKAGPITPSPSWKLEASPPRPEEPVADSSAAAAAAGAMGRRSSAVAASARQLGATLWEIRDVIKVAGAGRRIRRRGRRGGVAGDDDEADRPQSSCGGGEHLSTSLMEHDKLHGERCHARQSLSPASYTSSIGAATINIVSPTRSLDRRARFREAGSQLKTSTELLKVLNRIWSLEEQHAADVLAMKGLKSELQHAHARVQELLQERRRYHYEIDSLVRQVSEDKMTQKSKDQEKVKAALRSLQEEIEDERHLRKHSESLHRKLKKELSEMKSAFVKAVKDLEKEKKATHLLENLCDEFAFGIRNYEEEVRLLKQKHIKQYEHKFDKSVVHISEAWLDERMQMQNADPKATLAERISITERLSSEIHSFLNTRRSSKPKDDKLYISNEKQDASLCRQSLESVHLHGATSAPRLAEDDNDNSVASDLHCFELSMHGHTIQNNDLIGTRQRVTSCMYSPMRRLEFSNGIPVEGSRISTMSPCSMKDKARPNGIREQLNASTPEISPCNDAKNAPRCAQDETVMTQVSQRLHDDLLKIKSEAPQHAYLGQKSNDHHSRAGQFRDQCTTSGNVYDLCSPARQLNQRSSLDHEITEASPTHPLEGKSTTLKAKLLQARLEGQHARMRASGYSLTSTRRK
ncbi:uncharacterized protein At5g41620 [Oryza sativa Japonica Group]|uniref:Uncharacterized protein n=3 Tax=Oryza sativa subsp. japonica TaxID=39947 RepID=A3BC63_ORYSJ|nr:uncharacterized protein At5g41620 [Oryza sativa Japonica Group]EAZ37152.1 hypothetical protein OsJ_21494 [Oryza sativa Japonica Group]